MVKNWSALAVACCVCFALNAGQNLLENSGAEKGVSAWSNVKIKTGDGRQGCACFEQEKRYVKNKNIIAIDATKAYRLSGWVKNPTSKQLRVLIGIFCYDKNKRAIGPDEVSFEPGTDTALAADCFPADTVVKVKDASKWSRRAYRLIAFKTRPDYKDLPNSNLSPDINKIEKKGERWDITLKSPVGRVFPRGTSIRQHRRTSIPYPVIEQIAAGGNWRELKGKPFKKWPPGAAYCKIIIVAHGGVGLLFNKIKFEIIK